MHFSIRHSHYRDHGKRRKHRHKHHQVPTYLLLTVKSTFFSYRIAFKGEIFMGIKVSIGHKVDAVISFLDQHGNPMLTPVVPDSVPVWSQLNSAADTLTPSADGLSASAVPLAEGTDTVSVKVTVGGVDFAATLDVEVVPEPQVLTSVAIVPTVT